jgi:uncharacterized protein (DUF885 family)
MDSITTTLYGTSHKGADYTLRGFHDEFMRQGPLPLKLMRQALLSGNTAPLL